MCSLFAASPSNGFYWSKDNKFYVEVRVYDDKELTLEPFKFAFEIATLPIYKGHYPPSRKYYYEMHEIEINPSQIKTRTVQTSSLPANYRDISPDNAFLFKDIDRIAIYRDQVRRRSLQTTLEAFIEIKNMNNNSLYRRIKLPSYEFVFKDWSPDSNHLLFYGPILSADCVINKLPIKMTDDLYLYYLNIHSPEVNYLLKKPINRDNHSIAWRNSDNIIFVDYQETPIFRQGKLKIFYVQQKEFLEIPDIFCYAFSISPQDPNIIYFVSYSDKWRNSIYRLDLSSINAPPMLIYNNNTGYGIQQMEISPNGKYLAFSTHEKYFCLDIERNEVLNVGDRERTRYRFLTVPIN